MEFGWILPDWQERIKRDSINCLLPFACPQCVRLATEALRRTPGETRKSLLISTRLTVGSQPKHQFAFDHGLARHTFWI
jgi:hypothetical protein